MGESAAGEVELDVGEPAHGGSCVARLEGRVVFVRHALPGERVLARVVEDRGSFLRADAIAVLQPSPDRVVPPCPHAGPGRCGGCDWQHASGAAQLRLKAAVVREQFARLAGLDVPVVVEPLGDSLLGWRTRITYALDPAGRPGLHKHRSTDLERLAACPLGVAGVGDTAALRQRWRGLVGIEAVRSDDGAVTLLAHRPGRPRQARGQRGSTRQPGRNRRGSTPDRIEPVDGPGRVRRHVGGRTFEIAADGFWQVHPAAAATFSTAVLEAARPRPGERVLDLYAGAGMLTAGLAEAVGPTGSVLGVESSRQAVADATANLADLPWATVRHGRVDAALLAALDVTTDVVVLDPPRAGIGQAGMAALLEMRPRVVAYLACDPASLARDVRVALDAGWRLSRLRAFDAFPMTAHVECLAVLERA